MTPGERTCIVTGASAGIGLKLVDRLLDQGYRVVAVSRHASDRRHPRLFSFEADLTSAAETRDCARSIAERFAVTDIVHNAGAIRQKPLAETPLEDLQDLSQLHLGAAIALVQASLPSLRACGSGRIVLMSSRAALGLQNRTAYSATKAGMIGLARTWALELAPAGVTVNVVAPGPIRTGMFHELIQEGSAKEAQVEAAIPVGRVGTTDDVANATLFFLSSGAGFVTGQTLFVCGGASVGSLSL